MKWIKITAYFNSPEESFDTYEDIEELNFTTNEEIYNYLEELYYNAKFEFVPLPPQHWIDEQIEQYKVEMVEYQDHINYLQEIRTLSND